MGSRYTLVAANHQAPAGRNDQDGDTGAERPAVQGQETGVAPDQRRLCQQTRRSQQDSSKGPCCPGSRAGSQEDEPRSGHAVSLALEGLSDVLTILEAQSLTSFFGEQLLPEALQTPLPFVEH